MALVWAAGAPQLAAAPNTVQHPSTRFVDVSTPRGILLYRNEHGQGSGLSAVDYDLDGDIDVFVPQAGARPDQLYRNSGEGYFDEIASSVGLGITRESRVALWIDYDNDRDLDLFVANDDDREVSSFYLYQQGSDGRFTDVTAAAGLIKPPQLVTVPLWWGGLCAGDLNNDGYLEILSASWTGGPVSLFLNDGDGTFTDISISSGVGRPCGSGEVGDDCKSRQQPVMADFNGDGWLDIYIAVDGDANELWINQRNNTFINRAAEAGLANFMNDMGITLGDYDNDGDLDIYITNIFVNGKHNVLYRNDSSGDTLRYVDVSEALQVDQGYWGWGATFMDIDRDGNVDLATTNGYFAESTGTFSPRVDPSRVFWNPNAGATPFIEEGGQIGFDDTFWGSALVAADFDRDGDLDLMQSCMESNVTTGRLRLLDNQPGFPVDENHWLVVKPRIDGNNHFAVGAIVRLEALGRRQMRLISAGTSYLSQEPYEAFFGLGPGLFADVTVEWPDGTRDTVRNVASDQIITVTKSTAPPPPAPTPFALLGARPNPTAGAVDVAFTLPSRVPVRLELFDLSGRRIRDIMLGDMAPGQHVVNLTRAKAIDPGVYVVRLRAGERIATARVAVIP